MSTRRRKSELSHLFEELGIEDSTACSPYLKRFEESQQHLEFTATSRESFLSIAGERDIVLLGEYHPLPTALDTAAWLIGRRLHARPWCLGLEAIHARDQFHLDAFLHDVIDAEELHRRIHFADEWGYCWRGLLRLLERARARGVEVMGLDIAPRGGAESLELRDEVIAERLLARLNQPDRPRLMAVLGEAHLADEHLPSELLSRSATTSLLRLLHDRPASRARAGWYREPGRDLFVRDMVTQLARERSLYAVCREWAEEDRRQERADATTSLREMIDDLARTLGIDSRRYRVDEVRRLADDYPSVVCAGEKDFLERLLRFSAVGEERCREILADREGRIHFIREARLVVTPDTDFDTLSAAASEVLTTSLRGCGPIRPARDDRPPLADFVHSGLTSSLALRLRGPWPLGKLRAPLPPDLGRALIRAFAPRARRSEREEFFRRWRLCSANERNDSAHGISRWLGAALARAWSNGSIESKDLARAARWRIDHPRQAARCLTRLLTWTRSERLSWSER